MDFYKLFGIGKDFTETELKKAYYRLSLQCHPDKNSKSGDMFKYINKGYEILSSPDKKLIYDEFGITAFNDTEIKPEYIKHLQSKSCTPKNTSPRKKLNDFEVSVFDDLNENSLFRYDESSDDELSSEVLNYSYLNTGVKLEEEEEIIEKPSTIQIDVTMEELYCGAEKEVEIKRKVICPECFGYHQKYVICDKCLGNGFTYNVNLEQEVACSFCDGTGKTKINNNEKCSNCNGKVTIIESKTLIAHILPGMKHNEKIIFKGEGDQSLKSPPNDIIASINVLPHPRFSSSGNDLIINVKITLKEALCGLHRRIKFLDGSYLSIMTNPGEVITPNSVKSYRNKGLVKNVDSKEKGNLKIKFFVQFPENNWTNLEDIKILESILDKSASNINANNEKYASVNRELVKRDRFIKRDYPSPGSLKSSHSSNSTLKASPNKGAIDQFYQCDINSNGDGNPRTIAVAELDLDREVNPPRTISVIDSAIMPVPGEAMSTTSSSDSYYRRSMERVSPAVRSLRRFEDNKSPFFSDEENYKMLKVVPSKSVKSPKELELVEKNKPVIGNNRNELCPPTLPPPLPPFPKHQKQLSHTRSSSLEHSYFKNKTMVINSSKGKIIHSNTFHGNGLKPTPTMATMGYDKKYSTTNRIQYPKMNYNI